ncbi:MAG: DinB family protein, partial [Blastocatellia bacterium]|nr:DinB family protein [Blastocatellia bacterium]
MKNNLTISETNEKQWTEVMERHRAAVANYLQIASEITEVNWRIPVEAEKWTPAQITEHLILTYQVFAKQIRGEQNI